MSLDKPIKLTALALVTCMSLNLSTSNANAKILGDLFSSQVDGGNNASTILGVSKIQSQFDDSSDEDNVAIFKYDESKTYKINLRTSIATMINLPEDEKIIFFNLGDSEIFKVEHDKNIPNILNIKTLYSGFDTNLIVKTDIGHVYNFYLRSFDETANTLPHFTIYVKGSGKDYDNFKRQAKLLKALKRNNDYIKQVEYMSELNPSYKIKGDEEIAPLYVYDDGKWTYFDFGDHFISDRLPVIYKVVDDTDSVVNNRIQGNIIVAESLGVNGWILKNGDKYVCITPKKSLYKVYKDKRFK